MWLASGPSARNGQAATAAQGLLLVKRCPSLNMAVVPAGKVTSSCVQADVLAAEERSSGPDKEMAWSFLLPSFVTCGCQTEPSAL